MGRPTRLDDDLRRQIASRYLAGEKLAGIARAVRAHPSQLSRWKRLDKVLRGLLHAASIVRAARTLDELLQTYRTELGLARAADLAAIGRLLEVALTHADRAERDRAAEVLKLAIYGGGTKRGVHRWVNPEETAHMDEVFADLWDASAAK